MSEPQFEPINDEISFTPILTLPEDPPEEVSSLTHVESAFDDRYRDDFVGLLYLGKLEEERKIAGHKFLLRTPSQADRLAMGPLHKPWVNTITSEPAWRVIFVAAYLHKIDTEEAPEPLSDRQSGLGLRFEWVRESIASDVIIEKLFAECLTLDGRVRDMVDELDRLGES